MTAMIRTLHPLIGGLCVCLSVVVAAAAPVNSAATPRSADVGQTSGPDQTSEPNLDALVSAIQERPLFNADRHAPAPPVEEQKPEDHPEVKAPPVLRGRLAGVTLGPDDEKRAVFARPGEKPAVVKEGDDIDGWTISSIEASRVVLTSSFGEKVVQPTFGVAGEGATPEIPVPRKAAALPQPTANRPGQPGIPNFANPSFPNSQMARPPSPPGRPLAATRRNQ